MSLLSAHIDRVGAKASGQAVAFIARADDPSANWYNPAGLTQFDSPTISIGGSLVFYAWRAPKMITGSGFTWFSRESLLLANNVQPKAALDQDGLADARALPQRHRHLLGLE